MRQKNRLPLKIKHLRPKLRQVRAIRFRNLSVKPIRRIVPSYSATDKIDKKNTEKILVYVFFRTFVTIILQIAVL